MPKAIIQVQLEEWSPMKTSDLPRLILTPWGYITKGQALLNYREGLEYPEQTTVYDPKNKRRITIDWTEPGVLEERIGIEPRSD